MVLWPHGGDAPPVLNVQAKAHEAPVSSGVPGTAQTGRPLLTDTIVSGVCARSLVSHLSIGRQPVCRDDSCVLPLHAVMLSRVLGHRSLQCLDWYQAGWR